MDVSGGKINSDDLTEIFGSDMPVSAVKYLLELPQTAGDKTRDEILDDLRKLVPVREVVNPEKIYEDLLNKMTDVMNGEGFITNDEMKWFLEETSRRYYHETPRHFAGYILQHPQGVLYVPEIAIVTKLLVANPDAPYREIWTKEPL